MTTSNPIPHQIEVPIAQENGLPFVGILLDFLQKSPLDVLEQIAVKHEGIVLVKVGPMDIHLVTHPDAFQHILRDNNKNYYKPDMLYKVGRKVAGESIFTANGEFWLRQRRMLQPHMHRKYLGGLQDLMTHSIAGVIDSWESAVESGQPIDINQEMSHITMSVITSTMFGQGLSDEQVEMLFENVPGILNYATRRGFLPFLPNWMPIPGDQAFVKSHTMLREFTMSMIEKRRGDEDAIDLLSMLLHAVDDVTNEQMTDQQVFTEVLTIFFAGYETTSTALTWLLYALEDHPDVKAKLLQEVNTVVGERVPTMEDLRNLTYTRMVLQETIRLYTPIPMLPRKGVDEDVIGNQHIPADANVILFYHGLHHNEQFWDDPKSFRTERFTPENVQDRHRFAYAPFSAGPRKCIGDEFAMMEAMLATVMMLQRYEMKLHNEGVVPKFSTVLKPSSTLWATLTPR